jgi:hypothetical protein
LIVYNELDSFDLEAPSPLALITPTLPVEREGKKELLETDKISSFSSILSLPSPQTMGHKMYFAGN